MQITVTVKDQLVIPAFIRKKLDIQKASKLKANRILLPILIAWHYHF